MTNHLKSELSLLSELLLSILLTASIGIYFFKSFDSFPWVSFLGIPLGLALMVACWERKKYKWTVFIIGLIVNDIVWSLIFNGASLFKSF